MPIEDEQVHDDVRYLAGSPSRIAILRALRAEPLRPAAITRHVDATRTTVQRVLAGFRDRQWVHSRNATYRLTVTGRQVCRAYEELLGTVELARECAPLADHLTAVGEEIPPAALERGDLTVATPQDPLAPIERLLDVFEGVGQTSDRTVQAVSPIVTRTFNEAAGELIEAGTEIELVIDDRVFETSMAEFADATERAATDEHVSVAVHPEPLECGLFAVDTTTCLGVYDDRNTMRALLECDDGGVREWADDWFTRLWERSTPLAALEADDAGEGVGGDAERVPDH